MAFEKMTAEDLYNEFVRIFPETIMGDENDGDPVRRYNKVGARMLRFEFFSGKVLYFLWYDDNNWNLGTKPFRNKPKKQRFVQTYQKLKTEDTFCSCKEQIENLPHPEPIDWVKDDPGMLEKGIRVTQGHPEWDDVVPMGETASTVDI